MKIKRFIHEIGHTWLFGKEIISVARREGVDFTEVVLQMYWVGVRSLFVTGTCALFIGAVMAIQIYLQVRDFGGESFLGGLAASTTLRDVGPVLIGFVLSGKVGAYTSAELATMRVTDQIDALRCLGINPLRQLILPRMIAVVISSFLLLIVGLVLTVFGGMIFSEVFLNVNSTAYLSSLPRFMTYFSLVECIVKSFLFGCFIGLISCREGYFAKGGAEGVGETVRKTAVRNLFCILLSNFLISWMATQIQGAI